MLYATDTSTTIKKTLTVKGNAKALRLCPWGNGIRGFTGAGLHGERDEGIGLYLLGAGYRGYMPSLRRFIAPDSWSPFGRGGINAYMFCEGDPVNGSDPSGHMFSQNLGLMGDSMRKIAFSKIPRTAQHPASTGVNFLEKFSHAPHISEKIASYLTVKDLISLASTSRHGRSAAQPALKPAYEAQEAFIYHAGILTKEGTNVWLPFHARLDGTWQYSSLEGLSEKSANAYRYMLFRNREKTWTLDGGPAPLDDRGVYPGRRPAGPTPQWRAFIEGVREINRKPLPRRPIPRQFWRRIYEKHGPM